MLLPWQEARRQRGARRNYFARQGTWQASGAQSFLLVMFVSFRTRTRMRPSEWKLPPVAVPAVVTGSAGVTWVRCTTRPVRESVSLTYSRSPALAGAIFWVT